MWQSKLRHRRSRHVAQAELDVTPFMNLMIVLTPVLLLSLVFTHTRVLDIDLPSLSDIVAPPSPPVQRVEVVVRTDGVAVGDTRGGVIAELAADAGGGIDYARLTELLVELKRRTPDSRDVSVLLDPGVDYQRLVAVLDRVRAHPVVQDGVPVMAELFPDIALGDAPPRAAVPSPATAPSQAAAPAGAAAPASAGA